MLDPIGPDEKYISHCKAWLGAISLETNYGSGQSLIKVCFKIWFSVVVADLFSTGGINSSCKSSEAEVSGGSGKRGKHMTKIYYIKKLITRNHCVLESE